MRLRHFFILLMIGICFSSFAQYTETMDPEGLKKNMVDDYGLVDDDGQSNQTAKFQNGIDKVSALGGGILVVPKGTYKLTGVALKSNVHLQIEGGTVLRPEWPAGEKVSIFTFNVVWDVYKKDKAAYIENVSIRGLNGRFTVDYHDRILDKGEGIRAITMNMVKNFLVQDMDVKDNYTTYCGMTLSPHKDDNLDVSSWEVSRPTDGTIRNCRHFKASPGYGLVQLHGARRVHFEDLYSLGGVTLRLETGANSAHVGVFDITGKNIVNENGRCAIMMGPHSAKNGKITVDSVTSISATYTVTVGNGGVKEGAPDQTPGYFSNESSITNIHAIFGTEAQVKKQGLLYLPLELWDYLRIWPDNKFLDGPSIGAVQYHPDNYSVNIENVTMEGFDYVSKTILTDADEREGNVWNDYDKWFLSNDNPEHKSNKSSVIIDYNIEDLVSTATKAVPNSAAIRFYPNPASSNLFVQGTELVNSSVNIGIFDMTGKTLLEQKNKDLSLGAVHLNVENLKSGSYAIQIIDANSMQILGTSKVLISK